MKWQHLLDRQGVSGISGWWNIITDEARYDGIPSDIDSLQISDRTVIGRCGSMKVQCICESSREGVFFRSDTLTNTSAHPLTVRRALARFTLPCGEYEVYTQRNDWENESEGIWCPLMSEASVHARGIRGCEGAAPIMALWNRQLNRGIVFHVYAACAWQIRATQERSGYGCLIPVVELGVTDTELAMKIAAGETAQLPPIVFYTFQDRGDFECDRLHRWFLKRYPRRPLPVAFNTWMMTFDHLNMEQICNQARLAAQVGAEYFVLDAGWFGGEGPWNSNIGNWVENNDFKQQGGLAALSECVRMNSMKFGLWLEPERALENAPAVKAHPEWFFQYGTSFYLDFGNPDAREYITNTVIDLIRAHQIGYLKFDFNDNLPYDPTGSAFLRWHKGHEVFLTDIRAAFPDIWIENCASGGFRMELYAMSLFDSCWLSDVQSVYIGKRIIQDTMLRLPPSAIDRWPAFIECGGFQNYNGEPTMKWLASDDASWENVREVNPGWLQAFLAGGPVGLTFDLTKLTEKSRKRIADIICEWKEDRTFWQNASARILCDAKNITAFEFADDCGNLRIAVFQELKRQKTLMLFPHANPAKQYILNHAVISGGELNEHGITVYTPGAWDGFILKINTANISTDEND